MAAIASKAAGGDGDVDRRVFGAPADRLHPTLSANSSPIRPRARLAEEVKHDVSEPGSNNAVRHAAFGRSPFAS